MRIAHLADLHLGFRQFDRTNKVGANQREADVAAALHRAITDVVAAQPDVVLFAGDIFHAVRPTNVAIVTLFAELQRLRTALPRAEFIGIAGDHDSPRSSETGFILPLYGALDLRLALTNPARFQLADGWRVSAVPVFALKRLDGEVRPEGDREILLAHGEFRGHRQQDTGSSRPSRIAQDRLDGWAYVALGHYHVCTQVGPRAWYSGSLEYASSNPWGETREEVAKGLPGKGWLLVELEEGKEPSVEFRPVETRRVVDLDALDADGLGADQISAEIVVRCREVEASVVRLVVRNISRITQHALDHKTIREIKSRALHFELQFVRPEAEDPSPEARQRRIGQRMTDILRDFMGKRPLPADIDREALQLLAQKYFDETEPGSDPYTGEPSALPPGAAVQVVASDAVA